MLFAFLLGLAQQSAAYMKSTNYTIPTSVLSGGVAPMGSVSYQINSTLAQPSPLMDPSDPPLSLNYGLNPGFFIQTRQNILAFLWIQFRQYYGYRLGVLTFQRKN